VHALAGGGLSQGAHSEPLAVPLTFVPASTGLGDPTFASVAWSAEAPGITFSSSSGTGTTMHVPDSGDYVVRFDGTTTDGVHVVRTFDVTVTEETVSTPGYYTGTTAGGGGFVLIVDEAGHGRFYADSDHGGFASGFIVAPWGEFSTVDQAGSSVTGRINAAGVVTGTLGPALSFTGGRLTAGLGGDNAAIDGDYRGWMLDTGIRAVAHVGQGRVTIAIDEEGAGRAAEGGIDSVGTFALSNASAGTFTGAVGVDRLIADVALAGEPGRSMFLLRTGPAPARQLVNLSLRGAVGTGERALIPGFVVGGPEALPVLVRGIGPGLGSRGVATFVERPRVQLFANNAPAGENAGWAAASDADAIVAAAARVGAFELDPAKLDAALLPSLQQNLYTAVITDVDGGTGIALAEVYDARTGTEASRLVNLSGRGYVGTGDEILIGGFVVAGDAPALVLVRAVGPTLVAYGVSGVLAQPVLTIYRGTTAIAQSAGWSTADNAPDIAAAAQLAGAFGLPAGSADAALLLFLEPGEYTAHVNGVNDTTGVALAEVYLVPDF
jgi:hypothetical protein